MKSYNKIHYNYNNYHLDEGYNYSHFNYYSSSKFNYGDYYDQYNPQVNIDTLQEDNYIQTKYPDLSNINSNNQGLTKTLNENSSFFVIKSFSEENVHKSIKYGLWSSSKLGNHKLKVAFNETRAKGGFVYLFFSINGSRQFIGVARITTQYDVTKAINNRIRGCKWSGSFEVEWLFIKDIPFRKLAKIDIILNEQKAIPLLHARDTKKISLFEAFTMMTIFEFHKNPKTLFQCFKYYDQREETLMKVIQNKKLVLAKSAPSKQTKGVIETII